MEDEQKPPQKQRKTPVGILLAAGSFLMNAARLVLEALRHGNGS
ncbi:hypothetical protein ACWGH4_00375 [Streptomyces sp. NPDC054847]